LLDQLEKVDGAVKQRWRELGFKIDDLGAASTRVSRDLE